MHIERIQFLREVLVTDREGKSASTMEFSYDSGNDRVPHFFGVPDDDVPQARELYLAWGGNRPEGYRTGTTVKGPPTPPVQSKSIWSQAGIH